MANFDVAYKKIEKNEGGYVNDPNDRGGETYKGISRKYHPDSPMWVIIDDTKKEHGIKGLTSILKYNDRLNNLVKKIYKNDYWDVFELDDCSSQEIAEEIFDDAVNRGVAAACRIASKLLGMSVVSEPTDELKYNLKHYVE